MLEKMIKFLLAVIEASEEVGELESVEEPVMEQDGSTTPTGQAGLEGMLNNLFYTKSTQNCNY